MKGIIITSIFILFASLMTVNCFTIQTKSILKRNQQIKMEYIPDGMSKAQVNTNFFLFILHNCQLYSNTYSQYIQWELVKKKEAEANKGKNLGAIGITKFKSRSFEAFQKSGAKNLFPVSPDTPIEQRRIIYIYIYIYIYSFFSFSSYFDIIIHSIPLYSVYAKTGRHA